MPGTPRLLARLFPPRMASSVENGSLDTGNQNESTSEVIKIKEEYFERTEKGTESFM